MTLVATKLSTDEGEELLRLARRRIDGEDLDEAELQRYEQLVGRAAGDDELFARRRAEQAESDKTKKLRAAERRHPQAESLVAAVMANEALIDGLQHKLRPDVTVLDELGRERQGVSAVRIYEPDNLYALFVLLNLITGNGGHPITVREHGVLPDGLPPLPQGSLAQLRRNEWITTRRTAPGHASASASEREASQPSGPSSCRPPMTTTEVAARGGVARTATIRCPHCGEARVVCDRSARRLRSGETKDARCAHCRAGRRIRLTEDVREWAREALDAMTPQDRALVRYALEQLDD